MPDQPRSSMLLNRCVLFVMLASLAACQTAPKDPAHQFPGANWLNDSAYFKQHLLDFEQMQAWRYSAKVGIRTPQLQEQANLVWRYTDQSNDVRLFGPLGVGSIKVEFDEFGVRLKDNKGMLHQGANAEALLTRIVGWPIPVDALSYWLHGLPSPAGPHQYQLDESDQLVRLKQFGWVSTYADYQNYQGRSLARKLTATKEVTPEQTITVKLVTKRWQWQ